jgi:hypothetical protein
VLGWRSFPKSAFAVCLAITAATVTLLRNFGPPEIIFMTVFTTPDFPVIL